MMPSLLIAILCFFYAESVTNSEFSAVVSNNKERYYGKGSKDLDISSFFIFLNSKESDEEIYIAQKSSGHPDVLNFIDSMAERYRNISRERLILLFDQVNLKNPLQRRLSNQLHRPAEKVKNWESYRDQFVNQERVAAGVNFYRKHQTLLKKINQKFSVPISIILATIGLESYYGKASYRYPVFTSLVINSFVNNYRQKFYLEQLKYFLLWAYRNQYSDEKILSVHGSYSGALGPAQFIPFSIHHYGHDYNEDGKVDMLESYPDVLASIANYYHKNGWKKGKKVVTNLSLPCKASKNILSLTDSEGKPRCWKKEHNFKVILTYNRNHYYAQALYLFSLAIYSQIKYEL